MEKFRFSSAAEKIYHYTWHTFADQIIEKSKIKLQDQKSRQSRQHLLVEIMKRIIIILHPFAPFITEKIYGELPIKKKKSLLIIEDWPN